MAYQTSGYMRQLRFGSDRAPEVDQHADVIVAQMLRLFRGDARRVMQQLSGRYGVLHSGAVTESDLRRHLAGDITAAVYLLDESERCATVCFDIDIPKLELPEAAPLLYAKKQSELLPEVQRIVDHLTSVYGIKESSILVEDTGGRGFHLWLFFESAQPGRQAVTFGEEVRVSVGTDNVEIFPPSGKHGRSGYSKSLVRLPLGIHKTYPGARSIFMENGTYRPIAGRDIAARLDAVEFIPVQVLAIAQERASQWLQPVLADAPQELKAPLRAARPMPHVGEIGGMLSLCPALSHLVTKAKRHGHLLHHERLALALILTHCDDGEEKLHGIVSHCDDYSPEETGRHIASLEGYYPISCKRLQGPEYDICPGWCCREFEDAVACGRSPTPLWFAHLRQTKDSVKTDGSEGSLLERVAAIENLHLAWKQARVQARERDVFEDTLAYDAFEKHLWANLHVLRAELLSNTWKHQAFRVVLVPKTRDNPDNARPMHSSTPWDAVVALAVLNIIGPPIDSMFHENCLGNRLASGPRADGQVFEDWRRQNRYREIRREGFSRYGEAYQYILTDIVKFYEHVRHDRLMTLLRDRIGDQSVLAIIQQFLEAPCQGDRAKMEQPDRGGASEIGLPQGPALSAFLANLYLDELDWWLEQRCVDFVRYVDDLAVLLEGKEEAQKGIVELGDFLRNDLSLSMSDDPSKAKGPLCASDSGTLSDWMRDARYELVKYARRADSLTVAEKDEMRAALASVAGADLAEPGDLERLVKYLGFYVSATERLEQPELQKGVYALALYVLGQERPKHNATSIAVRALIKACSDFGDSAWHELRSLLESRPDPYFRVILAQETKRFVEEAGDHAVLHQDLRRTVEEQVASNSQTAAAAAITCLLSIGETSSGGRDLVWQRFIGDDSYLRPRAAALLGRLLALNPTAAARVRPNDGDEAALFLVAIEEVQTKPIVDSLADAVIRLPLAPHAGPPLLWACISVQSQKGLQACAGFAWPLVPETTGTISYFAADRAVRRIVAGRQSAQDLVTAIRACVDAGQTQLAGQLYDLGRYAQVIGDIPEIDHLVAIAAAATAGTGPAPALPVLPGVKLTRPIANQGPGVWLHTAETEDGCEVYHEALAENQLEPLGQRLDTLAEVLSALCEANLLLLDKVQLKIAHGTRYLLTVSPADGEWQTLADWVQEDAPRSPQEYGRLMEQLVNLLHAAQQQFHKRNLPVSLLPVPTCQSVAVNTGGEVRFRNVTATLASGRRYVGLDRAAFDLPPEGWVVFSLGLLFFEVVSRQCATHALAQPAGKSRCLSENAECKNRGAVFAGIIGKATAREPANRYENPDLFLHDVQQWTSLETALAAQDLGSSRAGRLRHLRHIELSLARRVHLTVKDGDGFLVAAPWLATYVLQELDEGGELSDDWLRPHLSTITVTSPRTSLHAGTLQTLALAETVKQQWLDLTNSVGLQASFTAYEWLRCAAAVAEIEAARRALCELARSTLQSVCEDFCVETQLHRREATVPTARFRGDGLRAEDEALLGMVGSRLDEVSDRLATWLSWGRPSAPDPLWPSDLAVMGAILLMAARGIVLQREEASVAIGPSQIHAFETGDAGLAATSLFALYEHEVSRFSEAAQDDNAIREQAEASVACAGALRRLALVDRQFAWLPAPAFPQLMTREFAHLDLGPALRPSSGTILVSGREVLPFPKLSPPHGAGCPFSADIVPRGDGSSVCVALSLPAVVRHDATGGISPSLHVETDRPRKKQNTIFSWKCFMGVHTLILLPAPLLYAGQVYARLTSLVPSSPWIDALERWIPTVVGLLCLGPYGECVRKRYRLAKRKEKLAESR